MVGWVSNPKIPSLYRVDERPCSFLTQFHLPIRRQLPQQNLYNFGIRDSTCVYEYSKWLAKHRLEVSKSESSSKAYLLPLQMGVWTHFPYCKWIQLRLLIWDEIRWDKLSRGYRLWLALSWIDQCREGWQPTWKCDRASFASHAFRCKTLEWEIGTREAYQSKPVL